MTTSELASTARALVPAGKGLLAADESTGTIAKRFGAVGIPKTIDNDLPLPDGIPTFGYTTAVDIGKSLVRNLMQDAATTGKWFFVTVMGRHAGPLTLLARLLKARVTASLAARGIEVPIVAKEVGYELRCAPPSRFAIQYCRSLGYWAVRFLLEGGTGALVTVQAGKLVPTPFHEITDPATGRVRVRYVDVTAEVYEMLSAYMIRLTPEDLADSQRVRALAAAGRLREAEFTARFGPVVAGGPRPG